MEDFSLGKWLILIGTILIVVGVLSQLPIKFPFGRLPGDIVVEKNNLKIYFPIVTCVLLSLILSIIFFFLKK